MQYRKDKHGNELSILGFGCMRFIRGLTGIDSAKAEKEIMHGIDVGINYFDTAYVYPGSEVLLGEVLSKNNVRDKIKIATKLPHYLTKNIDDVNKIFDEELKRLKRDHIDYYIMHMINDEESLNRLVNMGIIKWL